MYACLIFVVSFKYARWEFFFFFRFNQYYSTELGTADVKNQRTPNKGGSGFQFQKSELGIR
jgi:hypothetical protein